LRKLENGSVGGAHRHSAIFGRAQLHAQGFAGLDGAENNRIKFFYRA